MIKRVTKMLTVVLLSMLCLGCSRLFSEGMGAARGASGKVVEIGRTSDLTMYKGLRIESITVGEGLQVPAGMPNMIRTDFAAAAEKRGLMSAGQPALTLSAKIVHYETSSTVDKAVGPLSEVIVQAKLTDARSGKVVAEANLIGRSKATSSSSVNDVSEGAAKALDQWLKSGGLKEADEKEKN